MFALWSRQERENPQWVMKAGLEGGSEDGADKGDLLHTWEDGFDI